MSFRGVFIAVVLGTAMVISAFLVNHARPEVEVMRPTAELIRANGKCAECHIQETAAVVHEFEMSRHNAKGINCLDCHQPVEGQEILAHKGFNITQDVTAANCRMCHQVEYEQFLKSRHAAPAWAAVAGKDDFTAEMVSFAEGLHPGAVDRPANALAKIEGQAAITKGCAKCHEVGRPNKDGTIGSCTSCHARHASSIELARTPQTCGQCHMGPDHSQIEIYNESKHGVLFHAQKHHMDLTVPTEKLTAKEMPVPTCATCHMSGLGEQEFSHDTTERLSYFLFDTVTEKRPNFREGQRNMKALCEECHTTGQITTFYREAERVVKSTNEVVKKAEKIMAGLREEGLLTPEPFDEPIEYTYFDLWHYYGRTAKHGAFMGGADFVQWHGFYELESHITEIEHAAKELWAKKAAEAKAEPAKAEGEAKP
jgi:hypothetical protein